MKQEEIIKKMTEKEILFNVYITQLIIFALAVVLSWFLFESFEDIKILFKWQPYLIFVIGGGSALLIIGFELCLEKVVPKKMFDDGGINERVFKNLGVIHIFILSFIIAFSEELLFRGVLQTHFGIVPASILFAVIHLRYLKKIILFIITISLSFFLGWMYQITGNLLVPIFAHFTIDFVLGCILRFRNKETNV
ncbi:CAAX protease family protein [Anaerobacillus alkalilacustris]|uniref:CAAX protease family protein n=1 Tax=Anaerobacillus alkalilacustris TaxID=393763 RepID=A0A1S2LQR6_9BACI|nr:type II CAAX endopeptidase family protein [Anaerobacillus alkalilacustris]OIJ14851.1 CAAX protease family protein [Anaerobacillus alkalilacustris]